MGLRGAVLAIGLLVLLLGFGAIFAGLAGPQVDEEISQSFVVPEGQSLTVRGRNGSIHYTPWDGREIAIRASKKATGLFQWFAERAASAVDVVITQDGRGVKAEQSGGFGWLLGNVVVHYDIKVPRDWSGDISLRTSNGRITAEAIHGDAELRTSNGAINVEGQSGTLRAHTSNGRVELADVDGVIEAESSNGAIRIDGGRLAANGHVRTSNGAIHIQGTLQPGASYNARTSNGRVTLVLVDPDVELDLRTSNGTIDLETDVVVSELGRSRLAGRIGNGDARLTVRTSNGDVTLSTATLADGV